MSYDTDRYKRAEALAHEKVSLAIIGMRVALNYVEFTENNKERAKNNVSKLIDKMLAADKLDKRRGYKRTISDKLSKASHSYVGRSSEIENKLENESRHVRWASSGEDYQVQRENENKLHNMARSIVNDPASALRSFADDYIYGLQEVEQAKKDQQMAAQKEAEAKKQAAQIEREIQRQTPTYQTPTPTTTAPTKTIGSHGYTPYPREQQQEYVTTESIQKEVDRDLQTSGESLDYGLRRKIEKHFGKEDKTDYYPGLYSSENIKNIYEFNAIAIHNHTSVPSIYYDKMVKMAQLAAKIAFEDLLSGYTLNHTKMAEFMRQFKPKQALQRYEEELKNYYKYYNKLSEQQRKALDEYAADFGEKYRKEFGIYGKTGKDIASVEDIKRVVNARIKNHMVEKSGYREYLDRDGYNTSLKSQYDFDYALQYMTIDEIASLYHSVRYKMNSTNYQSDSYGDDERAKVEEAYKQRQAEIQKLFAQAIRKRLTNTSMSLDMNEKEKEAYYTKEEIDLVAICRDIFKEEPKFTLYRINPDTVTEGYGNQRKETAETLAAAGKRYYGMGKLQQVLHTFDIRKLQALAQSDTLSKEEVAKVKKLF